MKKQIIFFVLFIFSGMHFIFAQNRLTISGYVREKGSRELLPGVNVYLPEQRIGTSTNNYGFYSISLPPGTYSISFSFIGYQTHELDLNLTTALVYDVELEGSITLKEVEVTADRIERLTENSQMSMISVPVKQIQTIPALLGEKDVFKALQLMPGVQKGSEGSSGLYVRGGGPDQNLIILDDAPVYNASHLFGFFSVFNGDAIKSIELTKGGFPARHGGRLSSVVEMTMKDGNKEKISGNAGIGFISSRLTLEGPVIKEKSSFLLSGRRTYIDALIRPFITAEEMGGYYFYDLNAKLNYDFGPKNKLYLSGYFGRDKFHFSSKYDTWKEKGGLYWQNKTATLRWNHLFNSRIFSNTSLIFSDYNLNIFNEYESSYDKYSLEYKSGIRDIGIKYDIEYHHSPFYSARAGAQTTHHYFLPSAIVETETNTLLDFSSTIAYNSFESGVYLENHFNINGELQINAGFRMAHFVADKAHYFSPEPRLSANYLLRPGLSVKAAYSVMNQHIHLLSNTGIGLPTDLWVPSTDRIAPQHSEQVSIGLANDILKYDLQLSVEAYYKTSKHILGYKPGASFLLLDDPSGAQSFTWQDNVTAGKGESYGIEWLLQKKSGKTSGWIGYTLSWTQLQFDEINFGKKFWARHDRRHDISIVIIHEYSDQITLSGSWVYGTGNAITLPIATFAANQHDPLVSPDMYMTHFYYWDLYDYGGINEHRMKPYHRLDIAIQFHKKLTTYSRTWEIGLYNAYNRHNPFFYFIDYEYLGNHDEVSKLKQVSIFPIIPSISYIINF
ncbi:MAG: TonB-dependent receptor [Bacteroidales bacterium]|nr:TonB-dependent receptor [Bacteroidales bacterium]